MEEYNRPFSLDELRKSLDKAHDTACGPDDIHYQLLKHLPKLALQVLLDLMNDIWETGDLPSIWKLANVIPIPNIFEIDKSLVAIGKHVIFTWITSHIGIHGNTVVDREAKNALDDPISNCSIAYTDFKTFIVKYISKRWKDSWDQQIHNKLQEMYSLVGKTPCSYGQNRKEQLVLTRCRIDHSRLTHSHSLNNEERPECIPCNSNFSLKHVLIDCVDVADVRQTFYNANSLSNLFINVAGDTILQFLKEINLHTKI